MGYKSTHISTHQKSYVYATYKPEYAASYLSRYDDLHIQTCYDNGVYMLVERFYNALEYCYSNKNGSIYTLSGNDFKENMTSYELDLVASVQQNVLSEHRIYNALEYLLTLEKSSKIRIYCYPDVPYFMPTDKSDVIDKAIKWYHMGRKSVLDTIKMHHKDIENKVLEGIKIT